MSWPLSFQKYRFPLFLFVSLVVLAFWQKSELMNKPVPPLRHQTFQAQIVESPQWRGDRTYLIGQLPDGSKFQLTVPELCWIHSGSQVEFNSTLKEPNTYQNPGVFHYKAHLIHSKILRTGYVQTCDQIKVLQAASSFLSDLRLSLLRIIQEQAFQHQDILAALILAEKSLSTQSRDFFQSLGLIHLLTISGTHFAILFLICFWMMGFILNRFSFLFHHIPRQKLAAWITLFISWFYVACLSYQPSLVRAALMVSFYLISVLLSRKSYAVLYLLWSAIVILVFSPMQIFHIGFQLSYLAVLFLIGLSQWLAGHVSKWKAVLILSFSLQVFLAPILVFYFGRASLAGFVHNLWAIPVFQFVILPLVFLVWLSHLLELSFTLDLLSGLDVAIHYFIRFCEWLPQWKSGMIEGQKPLYISVMLFVLGSYGLIFFRKVKMIKYYVVLICALFLAPRFWHDFTEPVSFSALDVGQGDALVLQKGRRAILFDTGGSRFVPLAERVLIPYFESAWIDELEGVVISHGDYDHCGALFDLMDRYPPKWVAVTLDFMSRYPERVKRLQSQNIKVQLLTQGIQKRLFNQVKMKVFWPPLKNCDNENDCSVVAQLYGLEDSILLTGDISKKVERKIVEQFEKKLQSKILKVAHHGSKTSTSAEFLKQVKPKEAWISVKRHSHFGHPHQIVLNELNELKVKVLRTDQNGFIQKDY